jgi:splicing factor 3B subunit 2
MIELRKRKIESDIEGSETPALYKVVPEKATSIGSAMMGSSKVYDLSAAKKVASQQGQAGASGTAVFVTLNPDELDLNTDVLEARYNQQFKEQHQSSVMAESEDLSDMVVEHTTKQNKKKRKQETVQTTSAQDKDKANKKLKDFKF